MSTTEEEDRWCDHCEDWFEASDEHYTGSCPAVDDGDCYCHDCIDRRIQAGEAFCAECGEFGHDCEAGEEHEPGTPVERHHHCSSQNVHRHLLTEAWLCDCKADKALADGDPVQLAYALDTAQEVAA